VRRRYDAACAQLEEWWAERRLEEFETSRLLDLLLAVVWPSEDDSGKRLRAA
jgi:hypothetical protein